MSKEEKKPPPRKRVPATKNPYAMLQNELQKMVKQNDKKDAAGSRKVSSLSSGSKNTSSDKNNKSDKMKQSKDSKPSSSKDNEEPDDPDVPNRTYGDLYCKTCDSHMNSEGMWEAHITGKRHIKNVKKGDTDSKYDVLDVESALMPALKDVKEPIVGLSYLQETRRREPNVPSCYNCFLCHSSLSTPPLVIEHLISKKHRLNYIREHSPSEYELIAGINLKKGVIEPLVYDAARKLEEKFSRGTVIVKIEKPKRLLPPTGKRNFDYDDDDDYKRSKFSRSDPKKPYAWRSVDTLKKSSSREFETQHKRLTYYPDEDDFKRRRSDSPEPRYEYMREFSPKQDYMQEREYPREDYPREDYSREKKYARERDYSPEKVRYEKSSSLDNKYSRSYEPQPSNEDIYSKPRKTYSKPNDSSPASEQYHPLPSSFQQPPAVVLPHEKPSVSARSEPFDLKDFVQKVFALPAETFLKIAIHKMENMDLKEIDELTLLCNLMNKIKELICSKLPPEMQSLIKQKMNENVASPAPAVPLQTAQSPAENIYKAAIPQEKQQDFSFIRDILISANIATNHGPSHPSPPQPKAPVINSYQNNATSPFTTKAVPFQNHNTHAYPSPPQVEPRMMYQQNQTSPTQVNRTATYSASASYASPDPPSAYYNSGQTIKPSVNIPGLTLAENEQTESQLYSNYKTSYQTANADRGPSFPSTNSDRRSNYPPANSDGRSNYPPANSDGRQSYPFRY